MTQQISDFIEILGDTNKTFVMVAIMALGVFFRVKGYVNGTEWTDLMRATIVSFFGTATMVHMTGVIKDHLAAKVEAMKGQSK
jgi:hypothetical protein